MAPGSLRWRRIAHAVPCRQQLNCVCTVKPLTRGSTLLRRTEFPPIDKWAVADEFGDQFRIAKVAELPQRLRRPRVLEQDVVDLERIQLTNAEAVDG